MIRSKGEAGTGDANATGHMRQICAELVKLAALHDEELYVAPKLARAFGLFGRFGSG